MSQFGINPVQPQSNSPADKALAAAANNNPSVAAAATLIDRTDASAQAKAQFKEALVALENGTDLSNADRRRYIARVSQTFSRIAEGESESNFIENVDALLKQVREWLTF